LPAWPKKCHDCATMTTMDRFCDRRDVSTRIGTATPRISVSDRFSRVYLFAKTIAQ
jgi:hypothetical protein